MLQIKIHFAVNVKKKENYYYDWHLKQFAVANGNKTNSSFC